MELLELIVIWELCDEVEGKLIYLTLKVAIFEGLLTIVIAGVALEADAFVPTWELLFTALILATAL